MSTPLSPCPHREVIPGPLATPLECAQWAAALAAEECPRCASAPAPAEPAPLPALPPDVAHALAAEGRDGALRAQAALDALAVPEALHGAIAARLKAQPGTCVGWRRWWAEWRGGVLLACEAPAEMV